MKPKITKLEKTLEMIDLVQTLQIMVRKVMPRAGWGLAQSPLVG